MPEQNQEPKPYGWWREEQYSYGGIYQFLITKCLDYNYYLSFSNNPKKILADEGFILDERDEDDVRDWLYENLNDRKKELWWNDDDFQSLIDDLLIDPDYKEAFWGNYKDDGNLSHLILNDDDLQLFRRFVVRCYKDRKEEQYKMEVERGEHKPLSLLDWIKTIAAGILVFWFVIAFLSGAGGRIE